MSSYDSYGSSSRGSRVPFTQSNRSGRRPSAALPPLPPPSPPLSAMPVQNNQSLRNSRPSGSSSSHHDQQPQHQAYDNDRAVVMERMQRSGWVGVDSSAASHRSSHHSHDRRSQGSPVLEKRGSGDSGYSEGGGQEDKDAAAGYFGNWGKLKTAIWGEDQPATTPGNENAPAQGNAMWGKILSATSYAQGEDDEDFIGPDGDTKLTRCIKEYHISRAQSSKDLPDWLFSASDRSARTTAASRSAHHDDSRTPLAHRQVSNVSARAALARRPSIEDFNPFAAGQNASSSSSSTLEAGGEGGYPERPPNIRKGSSSSLSGLNPSSRAANRLRQMREEKRNHH